MLRQIVRVSLLALLLLLQTAPPSEGRGGHRGHHGGAHHTHHGHRFHGGTHVFIGGGPWWWGPPYPWGYYDPYWYYGPDWAYGPHPYFGPPRVVVEQPPIYIEQENPSTPPGYWYYCASVQQYYPEVPTCPEAWIRVPPRPN
jgi:hypothetical protein